jgi:predicted GNAT family acetyltransferase
MSIAELIMTGTQQASKSTDWVADSLAKIGDNVSKVYREREQNKQAQEMLPFLQQNLQESMTLAGKGQSGAAYSKMLGMLTPETLNNPQSMTLVKLGLDAIGKSTDDFLLSKKADNQGSSIVDLLLAKQLGLEVPTPTKPTTPSQPAPKSGNNMPSGGTNPPPNIIVEPENDVTKQTTVPRQPLTDEQTLQAAGDIFVNTQKQVEEQGTGLALSSLNYVDAEALTGKNLKDDFRIVNLPTTASKYLGQGIDKMLVPKNLEGLKQKGLSIKGSIGTINYENDVQDNQAANKLRQDLLSKLDGQFVRLDNSSEVQQLIKYYGGFDKIGPSVTNKKTGDLEWTIKDESGKDKKITLKSVRDKENPGLAELFIGVINSPNQAAILGMPMLRSGQSDQMPAVGAGRDIKSLEGKIGTDPKTGKQFRIVNGQPVPL